MTRTQFAVPLAVLFAGGIVGGALSARVRGGTVAYAQGSEKPTPIDELVVRRLVVFDAVLVHDGENIVTITPSGVGIAEVGAPLGQGASLGADGLSVRSGRSTASMLAKPDSATLLLDSAHYGGKLRDRKAPKELPRPQCAVRCTSDGTSFVELSSGATEEDVSLSLFPGYGPVIRLQDRAGNSRVSLGPNDNGTWQVGVWNANGRGRTLTAER